MKLSGGYIYAEKDTVPPAPSYDVICSEYSTKGQLCGQELEHHLMRGGNCVASKEQGQPVPAPQQAKCSDVNLVVDQEILMFPLLILPQPCYGRKRDLAASLQTDMQYCGLCLPKVQGHAFWDMPPPRENDDGPGTEIILQLWIAIRE